MVVHLILYQHKSSNLGCTTDHSIDLGPKVSDSNAVSAMHFRASLKNLAGWCITDALCNFLLVLAMPNLYILTLIQTVIWTIAIPDNWGSMNHLIST